MPIARFEMPDGRVGRFEVPEGTTPEQAQALISQSLQSEAPVRTGGTNISSDVPNVITAANRSSVAPVNPQKPMPKK